MSIYTQRERKGLYELTDVARAELIDSKYYNKDLAPTTISQRTWSTYNVASLWIGLSICLPTYAIAANMIASGMSTWAAMLSIAIGSLIVIVPIQLNSHAGTKYGVPYPVFARLAFGPRGAHIACMARAIVGCGWVGVQSWFGGQALHMILVSLIPGFTGTAASSWLTCAVFLAFNIYIAYKGTNWIKKLESWGAPLLILMALVLFVWATIAAKSHSGVGILEILSQPSDRALLEQNNGFWAIFMTGLTCSVVFWSTLALNIPDFSRYAVSLRSQRRGQVFGMPLTMVIYALFGAYITAATKYIAPDGAAINDLAGVINLMAHPLAAVLGAVGVVIATMTTNIAANVVAPAIGFSNLLPKKIRYRHGVIITGILSVILQPWNFFTVDNLFISSWIAKYGIVITPMAGIFIADYYLVKKKNMDVMSLFQAEEGRYWYWKGFNLAAFLSWALACVPPLIGHLFESMRWITGGGYFMGFFIALFLYPVLMKASPNSLVLEDEMRTMTER